MNCPACQTTNPPEQKFCGTCGYRLESTCTHCGAHNPPTYQFCGQCGSGLTMAGAITLARSGLITQVDQKTLDLLGCQDSDMHGRPFSLFVERKDLVIFFSHWNELLNHGRVERFEIALKDKNAKSVYVLLECSVSDPSSGRSDGITLSIKKMTENRLKADQMQYKQDLLSLVFSLADSIHTVSKKHLDRAIEDALKKICLFSKADRCCIYSINRRLKRIEPAYQWRQPESDGAGKNPKPKSIPFSMIKRAIVRLRRERTYVINDVSKLAPSQRYELLAWHQTDLGAFVCHLIYSEKRPIGIISLATHAISDGWEKDCVALVKFFGQLVSYRLPFANLGHVVANQRHTHGDPATIKKRPEVKLSGNVIDINEIRPIEPDSPNEIGLNTAASQRAWPDISRPMLLEPLAGRKATEQQPVFPRDDGLVLLTCPRCGLQESVSVDQFNRLGNAISVKCSCKKHFSAVLERRRSFRKRLNLEGFFTIEDNLEISEAQGSIWGPMMVKDLSKVGLRFSSQRADLVHPGDLLMVRFNLDNTNQSLIHKPARVISTNNDEVGCRFEGADSYDITLGFYFI
jgi:ribosomal protein L40E